MSTERHFYRPGEGHGLAHDPFNSIVAPRPIGWISSRAPDGTNNLAPYSFFNAFNYIPPIIGFCSVGYKDSVRNIAETRNFCWNLATRDLADAMNTSSASVPPQVDEFETACLTPVPGREVDAPRVGESPVNFECRVTQVVQLSSAAGETLDTHVVFGEVVGVHIDPALIHEGVYSTVAGDPILRGGGPADYFGINEALRFQLHRPG